MNLEQIIRPFQDRDITPPKVVIGSRKEIEDIHVSFGGPGEKVFGFSLWSSTELGATANDYKEIKRTTVTKRVENPDDPDQYVDVKNTTNLYTRNKVDPDKKFNIDLKPDDK